MYSLPSEDKLTDVMLGTQHILVWGVPSFFLLIGGPDLAPCRVINGAPGLGQTMPQKLCRRRTQLPSPHCRGRVTCEF